MILCSMSRFGCDSVHKFNCTWSLNSLHQQPCRVLPWIFLAVGQYKCEHGFHCSMWAPALLLGIWGCGEGWQLVFCSCIRISILANVFDLSLLGGKHTATQTLLLLAKGRYPSKFSFFLCILLLCTDKIRTLKVHADF